MKTCPINKNYILYNLKRYRVLILVYTALMTYIFPLGPFLRTHFIWKDIPTSEYTITSSMTLLLFSAVFLMMITPYIYFQYSNSKKAVDVFHSLPIARTQLFVNNVLLSFITVVIPYTLAYWLGVFLTPTMASFSILTTTSLVNYFGYLVLLFAIVSMMSFVLVHTGTSSDSVIYGLVMVIIPLILIFSLEIFLGSILIGYPSSFNYAAYISPFVAIFRITYDTMSFRVVMIVYWLILSLALFYASLFHYKRLKSETIESPFTSRYFYPLLAYLSTLIVFLFVFTLSDSGYYSSYHNINFVAFVAPFIISAIFYIILDAIRNRTFKGFVRSLKHYLGIAAISIILILATIFTNGFGYNTSIPSLNNTKSVEMRFSPGQLLFSATQIDQESYYDPTNIIVTDPEDIEKVQKFQRALIDSIIQEDMFSSYEGNITFDYERKFGLNSTRAYTVYKDVDLTPLRELMAKPELFIQTFNIFKEDVVINLKYVRKDNNDFDILNQNINIQTLKEAFLKDLQANPMKSTKDYPEATIFLVYEYRSKSSVDSYVYTTTLPIPNTFTNTLAYLKGY